MVGSVTPMIPMATPQITAFIPPLGPQPPNPAFYSVQPVTLEMKEKILSLSGDDFTITTSTGTPVCKCKGKKISLHGTKNFTDMAGNELFTVKNKTLALQKSFVCESPHGYSFEIKGHFSIGSSKSTIHFKNASDGRDLELDMKGDWFDRSAAITLDGRPVAEISRKMLNAREMLGSKQTYYVTVAPNVDLTLIAAICVCLDERENEKK